MFHRPSQGSLFHVSTTLRKDPCPPTPTPTPPRDPREIARIAPIGRGDASRRRRDVSRNGSDGRLAMDVTETATTGIVLQKMIRMRLVGGFKC